jgi:hypothetical protein
MSQVVHLKLRSSAVSRMDRSMSTRAMTAWLVVRDPRGEGTLRRVTVHTMRGTRS